MFGSLTSPTPKHRRGQWLIGILVAAVALGAAGCGPVTTPATSTPPTTTPSPTTQVTAPTLPATVAFDPTSGEPTPDYVSIVGTSGQTVVFDLSYRAQYDSAGNPVAGTARDILRGVDFTTGTVAWTLDTLPDGSPFTTSGYGNILQESGGAGNLAILASPTTIVSPASNPSGPTSIPTDSAGSSKTLILSPTTGTIIASADWSGCVQQACPIATIVAYQDGMVVLDQGTGEPDGDAPVASYTSTTAYRDQDLTTAVWQVQAAGGFSWGTDVNPKSASDRVLASSWVLAVSGTYVSLQDGSPSSIVPLTMGNSWLSYFTAGDVPIQYAQGEGNASSSLAAVDPGTGKPTWTAQATPAGAAFAGYNPLGCLSADGMIVATQPQDPATAALVAINLDTGAVQWSAPYDSTVSPGTQWSAPLCAAWANGDQDTIAYATGTGMAWVDATTGQAIANRDGLVNEESTTVSAVESCGAWTCVVIHNGSGSTVTGFQLDGSTATIAWTQPFNQPVDSFIADGSAFGADGVQVFAGTDADGNYQFLIV